MSESFTYKTLAEPQSITGRVFRDLRGRGTVVSATPLGGSRSVVFDLRSEDVISSLADMLRELLDTVRRGEEPDLVNLCSRHALAVLTLDELRERSTWDTQQRFRLRGREALMGSTVRLRLEPGEEVGGGDVDG